MTDKDEFEGLLEALAEIEHIQWIEWSKEIARSERISQKRLERWYKLWTPYSELPEDVKEQDRVYARFVIDVLRRSLKSRTESPDDICARCGHTKGEHYVNDRGEGHFFCTHNGCDCKQFRLRGDRGVSEQRPNTMVKRSVAEAGNSTNINPHSAPAIPEEPECCCEGHIDNILTDDTDWLPPDGHGAVVSDYYEDLICPACPVHGLKKEAGEK